LRLCTRLGSEAVGSAAEHLAQITSLEIWAEGVAGDFDIKIFSIGAGPLEDHRGPLMV